MEAYKYVFSVYRLECAATFYRSRSARTALSEIYS